MINKRNIYDITLLLLLLAAIFPFVALSFYNFPSADDLILSYVAKSKDVFSHISTVYIEWSGRYFSTFIVAVNPLVFGWEFGYKLVPVVLILFLYLSLYFLVKPYIFTTSIAKKHSIVLILLLLILQTLPSPVEAIFWLSGALTYTLPFILFFILLALIFNKSRNVLTHIAVGILAFLISGSNEIIMLLSFETLTLFIIYNIVNKISCRKTIIAFICSLAGTIVVLMSPGNIRRMDFFPMHTQFGESLYSSVYSLLLICFNTLKEPSILLFILIVFILSIKKYIQINVRITHKNQFFLIAAISFLILVSINFIAFYAMGIMPPPRIFNAVSVTFLLLMFFNIIVIGNYIGFTSKTKFAETPDVLIRSLLFASVILLFTGIQKRPAESLKVTSNVTNAWNDLLFEAAPYQKEMNERFEKISIAQQTKSDTLILKPFTHKPYTIFYIDITENPQHWINISFSEYYHLKYVKLQNENTHDANISGKSN